MLRAQVLLLVGTHLPGELPPQALALAVRLGLPL